MSLVELSSILTPEAYKKLKKGQTLGFKQEDGSIKHYKIIRINKTRRTCFAEEIKLYTKEEMQKLWDEVRNA